jgi:hypothetical protein
LSNVSDATGRDEVILLVATLTRDSNLLYTLAVAPKDEYDRYETTFQRVINSIRLSR